MSYTPRTDALMDDPDGYVLHGPAMIIQHARTLECELAAQEVQMAAVRFRAEAVERELAAAQAEIAALREERDAAVSISLLDARRLDWLIQNAYSGPSDELRSPMAVGLVIGSNIEWPNGIRAAIDAARAKS